MVKQPAMSREIRDTPEWNHEKTTEHNATTHRGIVFQGTRFRNVEARDLEFVDCDFRNVHIGLSSNWTNCVWRHCQFSGRYTTFGGPSLFQRCRFVDTRIDFVDLSNAKFTDCVFTGEMKDIVLRGSADPVLAQRNLTTSFTRVDMSKLHLDEVYFRRGFDLSSTTLPEEGVCVLDNEDAQCVEALRTAEAEAGEARSGIRVYSHEMYACQNPLPICQSTLDRLFRTERGRQKFWEVAGPFKVGK